MCLVKKNWYIIQHKSNLRDKAVLNLTNQGITVFLPQIEKTHKKGNKFVKKKMSLFPGYFFIKLEESFVSLNTINSTYGVLKILMFGRKPSIVSDKIIDELKRNCTTNDVFMNVPKFQAGDKVIFTNSPFASFVGKIQKVDASYRICVLLDYIGKKFNIISSNQNLQKI